MSKKVNKQQQQKQDSKEKYTEKIVEVSKKDMQPIVADTFKMETEVSDAPLAHQTKQSKAVSIERWRAAQEAERKAHEADANNTAQHYAQVYAKYFSYVGLGTDLQGLHIIEIGPAHHPALAICTNYAKSVIIEPMLNHDIVQFCKENDVQLIDEPLECDGFETLHNLKLIKSNFVEVWLFNVMQHVIDPDLFVQRCKVVADRIRFFEPINTPIEDHHPHTFSSDDFINWFGLDTKFYKGGTGGQGFHTADCAYGVWLKK